MRLDLEQNSARILPNGMNKEWLHYPNRAPYRTGQSSWRVTDPELDEIGFGVHFAGRPRQAAHTVRTGSGPLPDWTIKRHNRMVCTINGTN